MSRLATASLLILLLITVHASAVEFLEAPFFHNSHECKHNAMINIAMTLDDAYLRGSLAAVLSIVHHATCPEKLRFHFIYSTKNLQDHKYLTTTITTYFPYLHFSMHAFDEETVTGLISTSLRQALDHPLNYARSYLPCLLPESVHRVIYLDSDVILVDDIGKLWETEFADNNSVIAAPEYCHDADMTRYFTPTFWANPALSSVFMRRRSRACYFNTGVMVVDVGRWREREYTKEIEEWMELQKRMRIYELGSLPPFLLVFAGDVTAVARRWNQHGLGGDNYEGQCRGLHAGESSLLHWSGRDKPWVRLDEGRACPVDALWEPYDMLRKPLRFLHVDDH